MFNAETGEFSWTPGFNQAGIYPSVEFSASDGELETSKKISITVVNKTTCSLIDDSISSIKPLNLGSCLTSSLTVSLNDAKKLIEKKHNTLASVQLRVYELQLDVLYKTKVLSSNKYKLLSDNLKLIKTALGYE